jgi:hypothetical protein
MVVGQRLRSGAAELMIVEFKTSQRLRLKNKNKNKQNCALGRMQ